VIFLPIGKFKTVINSDSQCWRFDRVEGAAASLGVYMLKLVFIPGA
jgi:hypothetical protein